MANQQIENIRIMLKTNPVIRPDAPLAEMRKGLDAMGGAVPGLPGVTASAVDAGGVAAEWIVPAAVDDGRVLLYFHGGGYVLGSVQSHRPMIERLAVACSARVLALNYRLAPEAPFPAAVDDAVAAYRWLLAQGTPAEKIALAGDSAGGGLTLAALVALRDAGEPMPACAVPISPWTDMEGTGDSMLTRAAVDPMVQKAPLLQMAGVYLKGAEARNPLASPLHADFTGLPPLLIQVGDAETLLDDSTRLEPKLKAAGVEVTLEVWPDMIHVWHLFAPMLAPGQQAIERIGEFVREHAR
ncbi:MAG: alpha/beta hydrolase [Gammaproteobacteria bacterium]|nr:alpha/beta hydrolase [Gammaproteobacteria bacterium]MCP5200318.1 alpha/beta hydrolase [Gammaproteobacteria bacterium]